MDSTQNKYTNQLIHESSPYLLQHAHNPVNWHPWGKEALDKAKAENKLIIVSIGYAACHWCHVMEHESFENEEVANLMNAHFVAIKVDREERPDIDQIYMSAVQLLTGRGGWPLNCIALPDGRPVYGGTYFPVSQWMTLLAQVNDFTRNNPDKTEMQASTLTESLQKNELVITNSPKQEFTLHDLDTVFSNWKNQIDFVNGGQIGAPKFPLPVGYQFLLHYHHLSHDAEALKAVTLTLDMMADGGIYDQIGGGFSRYSTDGYWKVPHFEKMLYDNAQLTSLYSAAYQQTKKPLYKTIVTETLEFIQRELTCEEGGFYSSLDADSEGVEGKYYVWTQDELKSILGKDADLIIDYYNVIEKGNWEQWQNILFKITNENLIAKKHKTTVEAINKKVAEAKKKLLVARMERIKPRLDDKILTSWNGLMIKGYADAYRVFNDHAYLEIALKNAHFIHQHLKSYDNRLFRNFKNGKASINAFLDDYAFVIEAFISLYRVTFDEKWLYDAYHLCVYTIDHFYDSASGMFYYTSDIDPLLIARKMELSDNVIPSSNSTMAKNLFLLGHYLYKTKYIEMSETMLSNVKQNILDIGVYGAGWDVLIAWFASGTYDVAIIGKDVEAKRKEFETYYLPGVFLSGGIKEGTLPLLEGKLREGETTIYVCKNNSCLRPVNEVKDALEQII